MTELLHFDDLNVGDRWTSPDREICERDVLNFAELTGDQDPLHVDYDFAERASPFRKPVAHGLLGMSFVAGLGSESPLMDTVAFLRVASWNFVKPIFFGDVVHVVTEVLELADQGRRRGRVVWRRALVNQDGATVQEGVFETLVTRSNSPLRTPALAETPSDKMELQPASLSVS